MKNLHLLPTDKPSRLHYSKIESSYEFVLKQTPSKCNDGLLSVQKNIYITSDEEIKEGDLCLDIKRNIIFQSKRNEIGTSKKIPIIICTYEGCYIQKDCKKIILTTDVELIKDGVQTINDEFLEWFVQNPSCKEIEVKLNSFGECHMEGDYCSCYDTADQSLCTLYYPNYKIIIPKEEPKQETLEEAAENYSLELLEAKTIEPHEKTWIKSRFIACAKWQQDQIPSIIEQYLETAFISEEKGYMNPVKWFEQFKKK